MYIISTAGYKRLHACNKNSSYCSIIRTIQLSACAFFVAMWCPRSVMFSELVPSSSASIEGVGNVSPIKTCRNNNRVKYGLSIVFYRSWSTQARRPDVYKTWMDYPSYFVVHNPCIYDDPTYTKLEWLVHRILSFTVRAHATTRRIQNLNGLSIVFYRSQSMHTQRPNVCTTTDKCGACSGSPRLCAKLLIEITNYKPWWFRVCFWAVIGQYSHC